MKYRTLGKTGWRVSEIGFGGWGIGKSWWGSTDDQASLTALRAAWEEGINFFDTAFVYGDGHSEQLIAKALKGKEAYVATKIPPKNGEWPPKAETPMSEAFPEDWIISCTERSLKNLGRETLDLTQLHVWTDAWLDEEWVSTVEKLKSSGKIKAFGVSLNDHDPNSALKLVASGLIETVQVIFNIFDQTPTEKLFPLCQKHDVGVIVRVPFDEGGLSGTLTKNTVFEKGDFRREYFAGDHLIQTVEHVEELKTLLNGETTTIPDLALKFVLGHSAVSSVIPGMRKENHVRQNAAVSGRKPLSPSRMAELRKHAWKRNFYGWWGD